MFKKIKSHDYMRLLPQEITKAIDQLELQAYNKVEGFINGRHASPYKGSSVEFAEHRVYTAGDDVKNIDWKVYAKNDRYYVKQYQEETNLKATIVLDSSASMNYKGRSAAKIDGKPVSKFEYAQYLAAALSYLMINRQDAVGLITFDSEIKHHITPKSSPAQIRQILSILNKTKPGEKTNLSDVFSQITKKVKQRGIIIIISDFFEDQEKLQKAINAFGHRKDEIILFHIMTEEELSFPFKAFTEFADLENPDHVLEVDPKTIKAEYLSKVKNFIQTLKTSCNHINGDYFPISTREDFMQTLSRYLNKVRKGRS